MAAVQAAAPEKILQFLHTPCTGRVLLVTSKGIYLEWNRKIFLLCSDIWGITPIGISLTEYEKLHKLHIAEGQLVSWEEGNLIFPNGTLHLNLTAAKESKFLGQPDRKILERSARELLTQKRSGGLAMLAAPMILNQKLKTDKLYCQLALTGFSRLMEGLQSGSIPQIGNAIQGILGLGPGLTPSGDDVLCGMLYVLLRSSWPYAERIGAMAAAIREAAPIRTNAVSAAYLTAIAEGAPYQRMEKVWSALIEGKHGCIHYLTEVGSNSGSEMLLGMLLAGKLLCWMEEETYG